MKYSQMLEEKRKGKGKKDWRIFFCANLALSMKDNYLLCRWQQKALAKKSCGEGVPSPVGEGGPFARERWMRSNGLYRHLIR
ncbi:MAG: hypothetical protein IJ281_07500, partial [Clostridia bacterium]|nr:hypothetical protein [Clostridia bacterium]